MQFKKTTMALFLTAILASSGLLVTGGFPQSFAAPAIDLQKKSNSIIQHVVNDGTMSIDDLSLFIKKKTTKTNGDIIIEILQDGKTLASATFSTDDLSKKKFTKLTTNFDIEVTGDFDIKVSFEGKGGIKVQREKASKSPIEGWLVGKKAPKKWNLKLVINGGTEDAQNNHNPPPPTTQPTGQITVYAYRIPSEHWDPTFKEANAAMYFVVYNSDGEIIDKDYANEDGVTITGLESGVTYWISPTDCESCHGGDHDVRFHHWENGSTERQRPVVAADNDISVGAFYEYVPPTEETTSTEPTPPIEG